MIVVLCALMLLALSATAAAQSSTFVVPFDRVGAPGTTTISTTDPLTGEPTTVVVDTGAFVNPCTFENVDVTGASTVSTLQTVDRFGTVKVNVNVVTKGSGQGWTPAPDGTPIVTQGTYTFNDSQQFTFRLPAVGDEFSSDFSDKLAMKGAKSIDNWTIRAHFRIKINALGEVQVLMIKTNTDVCKG
jgi:hypothetical protein